MSGSNPFRRSQNIAGFSSIASSRPSAQNSHDPTVAARRFPSLNIEPPPLIERTSSKTKTVRIASPPATTPISPEYFSSEPESPATLRRAGLSPPPQNESGSEDDDPFESDGLEADDDKVRELLQNTKTNSAITGSGQANKLEEESDAVRRTLARFSARPQRAPAANAPPPIHSTESPPAQGKQQLDVDAFKRLLLTGNAGVPTAQEGGSLQSTSIHHGPVSESSSNTDTASVSRQSIFEPLPTVASDTPRTSHDGSPEMFDDDQRRLVGHEEKKRPPPPKTRHGKLIKHPPPATASQQAPSTESRSPTGTIKSPTSPGQGSIEADNPPPITPEGYFTKPISGPGNSELTPSVTTPTARRPPTPPVTRRKSQRESSKSGLTGEAFTSAPPPMLSPSAAPVSGGQISSTSSTKTPPTPPLSRGKRTGSILSPALQTASTDSDLRLNPDSPSSSDATTTADTPVSPPAPPLARNPSASSSRSQKRQSRPPGVAAGMPPPPPPPPRRNRGSSRGSMDSQRPSAQILADAASIADNGSRRGSGESNRNVSTSSNANDILADLAALQREVDELRRKQSE